MKPPSVSHTEEKEFTEFTRARILDKVGFTQPVEAFSILIPKDWNFDGGIIWNPPGSLCAGINKGMKAVSPDGKFIFEMFPDYLWSFNSDPMAGQFNQGGSQYCSYGEPMNAEAFFRNFFAPKELGNPEVVHIKENTEGVNSLKESYEKMRQELMSYGSGQVNYYPSGIHARVKWQNSSEAIVICGVTIIENIVPNVYNGTYNKIYTSAATERIVLMFPDGEYDKAANLISVMMGSIRTNTAWKSAVDNYWLGVRQKNNTVHIGQIRLIDDQTRKMKENMNKKRSQDIADMGKSIIKKGEQNLADMDANMRSWEASQQSNDRIHTNFVKAIREVETYRDESGVVELSSGYNHAWSKGDGSNFIMSNDPNFDPSKVFQDQSWTEMRIVK
jgi:hypothetical protein